MLVKKCETCHKAVNEFIELVNLDAAYMDYAFEGDEVCCECMNKLFAKVPGIEVAAITRPGGRCELTATWSKPGVSL